MKELLRLVLTVAVTVTLVLVIQERPERPATLRVQAPHPPDTRIDEVLARLDGIERRITAQPELRPADPGVDHTDRFQRIEQQLSALQGAPPGRRREEDPRFRHLDNTALRSRALALSQQPGPEAVDAWNALLARDLPPKQRAKTLDSLATLHRKMDDYSAAADLWASALEVEGIRGTETGQGYSHSRAWALLYSGERRAALAELDVLLAERQLTEAVESSARFAAGSMAYQLGDHARARREYRTIIDRWRDSEHQAYRDRAASAQRTLRNLKLD